MQSSFTVEIYIKTKKGKKCNLFQVCEHVCLTFIHVRACVCACVLVCEHACMHVWVGVGG